MWSIHSRKCKISLFKIANIYRAIKKYLDSVTSAILKSDHDNINELLFGRRKKQSYTIATYTFVRQILIRLTAG